MSGGDRIFTITIELSPAEHRALETLAKQQPPKTPADILRDEFACVLHDRLEKLVGAFGRWERIEELGDAIEDDFEQTAFAHLAAPAEAEE